MHDDAQPGGDRVRIVGLFLFFLFVIAAFWIQKPIRTSRFLIAIGPENLPWAKLGTALIIVPVVLAYSAFAARFRRQYIVYACCGFFAAASIAFWWLFRGGAVADWTHYAFFLYVDIFNSVMVALFWSFANDLSSPEQAQRDYGVIGAGGIIGGALGSGVTGWSVEALGAANLLLICVALLLVIAAIAAFLTHGRARPANTAAKRDAGVREAVAGARLTFQSRYLTYIALLVVAYEIASNVIDYQFNILVAQRYEGDKEIAAFLGQFSTASIVASGVVQFVLTTWILRRFGPRVGLLVLPIALALGSGSFLVVPAFAVIAATFFAEATLGYSLNQASKEVLYTPTDEATKYQAKAFIDMFLMRLGKAVSSLLILGWAAWLLPQGVQQLALLSLVVIAAWFFVARAAGREFTRLAGEKESQPATPSSPPLQIGKLEHA